MYRWLILVPALFLLGATFVYADIPGFGPRPRRPMPVHPGNAVPMVIQAGAKEEPARLLIPRWLLARAKKATSGRRFGAVKTFPLAALGLLSCAGLGVVCFCGRRLPRMPLALFALLAIGGAGVSIVWANAPPPISLFESRRPTVQGQILKELQLDGVKVEITSEGDTMRLIVPAGRLTAPGKGL